MTQTYRSTTGHGAWAEPGPETVAPGVHRVPLPLPGDSLRAVNVYVLESAEGLVLVDGGWDVPEGRAALQDGLAALGAGFQDVRRLLVTHIHRDHYTLGAAIARENGASVSLGAGEQENVRLLRQAARKPFDPQLVRLRELGALDLVERVSSDPAVHDVVQDVWSEPDAWLDAGPLRLDDARELEVVPTPGHTLGHVVFHDHAHGLLFAGDHVLPTITPSLGLELAVSPDPLGQFLGSLALVRSRPDAVLLPAHGPAGGSVHARVDELLDHHSRRLDQTLAAATGRGLRAHEVAAELRWTRREHRLEELDLFNEMLAVVETSWHLDVLVAQGRLSEERAPDGLRYR